MPLGAARLTLLAFQATVEAEAEVIRRKVGVSAEGNAQVDTAQSKFGGASALFDGTGDYLTSPHNTDFDFTDGNARTVEFWFRTDVVGNTDYMISKFTGTAGWRIALNTSSKVNIYVVGNGNVAGSSSTTISTNTWYHVALVYDGDKNIKLFLNGTQEINSSFDSDENPLGTTSDLYIGRRDGYTTNDYDGYIDEIRISNTARYTSNFTPDTTPFVNDDNTKLLLHMNGTDASTFFEDDNGVREQIGFSAYNSAEISTDNNKFGGASMYTPGGTQMSTADYIEANFDHGIGTGDFTVEWWNKWETSGATNMFSLTDSSLNVGFEMRLDNAANWRFYKHESSGSTFTSILTSNNEIYAYQANWNHFAWVRESGTVYLYVNGTKSSVSASYSTDLTNATIMHIGSGIKSGYASMNGYMDEVRVSNTARYTASFTAPTEPFTNDSDTILLLHMNGTDGGTDFRDDNGKGRSAISVSANGNAQVDTAQSEFGGASALFDGTGDSLNCGSTLLPATDSWTVEMWVYGTALSGVDYFFSQYTDGVGGRTTMYHTSSGKVGLFISGGPSFTSTGTLTTNTWHHIAWVRNGNDFKIYIDGTEDGSGTSSVSILQTNTVVGAQDSNGSNGFIGNIDEVRVSNTARYTAGFTAPTEPFTNDANTTLLLHMDGTDASTTFIDDNGTYTD